ncbi:MAG: ATP-binding protein [Myxococcota bacterium]|jgi:signal transduction histidine kinase/streptogramin lyase|nr:ATP-binding protein [Myxococcota bacterium]
MRAATLGAIVVAATELWTYTAMAASLPPGARHVCQSVGEDTSLATQTVASIVQDGQGFLWIGAMDGLFRYDGRVVERFGPQEGLPSPLCIQLVIDARGSVWASTHGGVARFDGRRFAPISWPIPEDEQVRATPRAQHLAFAEDGSLLVASGHGVWQFPPSPDGNFAPSHRWTKDDGLHSNDIDAVFFAWNGVLWLSAGGVLSTIDTKSKKVEFPFGHSPFSNELVHTIHVTHDGTVWVRGQHHLWRASKGASRLTESDAQLPPATFFYGMPALDRTDRYLLPTSNGLYYETQDNAWERLGDKEGLPVAMALCAFEDHEGAVWIGLGGSGVARCPGLRTFRSWTAQEGLPDSVIWNMARDRKDRLWVGTGAGLALWTPGAQGWKPITTGLAGNNITQVAVDSSDGVWFIASRIGIGRIDPDTLEVQAVELPPVCRETPVSLQPRMGGEVWAGGTDCLLSLRAVGDGFEVATVPRPSQATGCTRTQAAQRGTVTWSGGPNGLCRFDGQKWAHYFSKSDSRQLRADGLSAVSPDEVWVTNRDFHGLTHVWLEKGGVRTRDFFAADGLLSDSIFLVGQDALGRVFAGGNRGISVLENSVVSRFLTRSDGLIWNDVSSEAFLGDRDGTVLIGTSRGLSAYDPREDGPAKVAPKVVARSALAAGVPVDGRASKDIVLHPENTALSIELSCLTFRQPESVSFSYRLSGLEQQDTVTHLSLARYPTLPPGRYEFVARCQSAAGVWSSNAVHLRVVVLPPWWQTWWFLLTCVVGFVALVAGAAYARIRIIHLRNLALEAKVKERTAELEIAHARIVLLERETTEKQMAGGFAHEVRNSLVGAKLVIGKILDPEGRAGGNPTSLLSRSTEPLLRLLKVAKSELKSESVQKVALAVREVREIGMQVEQLTRNASTSIDRSLEVTSAIADYSRIGTEEPGNQDIELCSLAKYVIDKALRHERQDNVSVELEIDPTLQIVGAPNHFTAVLEHLLSNALDGLKASGKPASETRRLKVSASLGDQALCLAVWDNGVGIETKNLRRVFQPFFSTKPSTGMGLGLGKAAKYLALYGGTLELHSQAGQWTEARVLLPRRFVNPAESSKPRPSRTS